MKAEKKISYQRNQDGKLDIRRATILKMGDHTVVPGDHTSHKWATILNKGDHSSSRRSYVTSHDQLCLSATIRASGEALWSKFCHTTKWEAYEHTSTSTLQLVLGLHDHECIHTTKS